MVKLSKTILISGSKDNSIKLWDLSKGICIRTLYGHTNSVNCLLVLSQNQLASGSNDNSIIIWDLSKGTCLKTLNWNLNTVTSLVRLSNKLIISGSLDNSIKVWDIQTDKYIETIYKENISKRHSKYNIPHLKCLLKINNTQILLANNKQLKLLDLKTEKSKLVRENESFNCLLKLSDNKIASGSSRSIIIWLLEGDRFSILKEFNYDLCDFIIKISRTQILTTFQYGLKLWDLTTGNCLNTIEVVIFERFPVKSIVLFSNTQLAIGSNIIMIFDLLE